MASNIIFRIAAEYDSKGTDDVSKALDNVKNKFQEVAGSARTLGTTLRDISSIIKGAAFSLPLAGFVNEAIKSEEATARFGLQLKALGQSIDNVDIEGLSNRVRSLAGITQTELVTALNSGLRYFKSTEKELTLLNTALGMSKVAGISLADAFQQLGYIQLGYTRIARQYGVSVHNEIREPTARAAAVIADMTKKMEPLAAQTGTTAEKLKIMKATVADFGEKIGAGFLAPIAEVANAFNKLNPAMQETIVLATLTTTTIIGLSSALKGLAGLGVFNIFSQLAVLGKEIQLAFKFESIANGLGALRFQTQAVLAPMLQLAAAVTIVTSAWTIFNAVVEYNNGKAKIARENAQRQAELQAALTGSLGDYGQKLTDISGLEETVLELRKKQLEAAERIIDARKKGNTDDARTAENEIKTAQARIEGAQTYTTLLKQLGIQTEDQLTQKSIEATKSQYAYKLAQANTYFELLQKSGQAETEQGKKVAQVIAGIRREALDALFKEEAQRQRDLEALRIAGMKSGFNKEIAELRSNAIKEREETLKQLGNTLEVRRALVQKYSQDELAIRQKYIKEEYSKQIEFALKSFEEQTKFLDDQAKAQAILSGTSIEDLQALDDESKAVLQTEAGRLELEKAITEQSKQQAELKQKEGDTADKKNVADLEYRLALEKNRLAALEKTNIDISGKSGEQALSSLEKQLTAQREITSNLEKQVQLAKEQSDFSQSGLKGFESGLDKKALAKVDLTSTVNVNITPNSTEIVQLAKEAVGTEIQKKVDSFYADMEKRFKDNNTIG